MAEQTVKALILGMTALAAGGALSLVGLHFRDWRRGVPFAWAWLSARLGFAITILLVGEAVFGTQGTPLTWRSVLYAVGLVLAGTGFAGILVDARRKGAK